MPNYAFNATPELALRSNRAVRPARVNTALGVSWRLSAMLPSYDEIRLPLLAELHRRGGQSRPRDKNEIGQTIYTALAKYFSLTPADINEKVFEEDGTARSKWENMVRWARNDLKKQGLLLAPSHGVWAVGESGLALLNRKRTALGSPYNT